MLDHEVEDREAVIRAVFEDADAREQDARRDVVRIKREHVLHHRCRADVIARHEVAVRAHVQRLRVGPARLHELRERIERLGVFAGLEVLPHDGGLASEHLFRLFLFPLFLPL